MQHVVVFLAVLMPLLVSSQLTDNPDKLLNWCLDAVNHKTEPGPEGTLYSQCSPWAKRSCCTENTTRQAHHSDMYNFTYNHCGHLKNMSSACKRHFVQDLCFYECSPNIGPWVVQVDMKIRKERFYKVPLCASDCISWFNDCAADLTCTDNWTKNFKWKNGKNTCPEGSQCTTFREMFGNAPTFCEQVWDESWEYTTDDKPCMRIWFNGTEENPNDRIARLKVQGLIRSSSTGRVQNVVGATVLAVLIVLLWEHFP